MRYAGLGQVNVQALAQAMQSGSLGGSFVPTSYDQFPGVDQGPTDFTSHCLDDATSARIASLLGASVVKLPVESIQATNGPVPLCNWVQTPDGIILASDVLAIGGGGCNINGLDPLCCLEQLLADNIPGGEMDSSCTYASGTSNPLIPAAGGAFVPTAPAYVPPTSKAVTPVISTPVLPVTPVTLPASQAASGAPPLSAQVVTGTPGSSVNAATGATAASDVVVGGFDLSQVPWYVWLGGAAVLAFAFGGNR